MNEPVVAITCLVFNHEKYIRQCLEGIVKQKTKFPFIAIVHDDASTDNSAEIIHEFECKYPNIIKTIYENENQYSKPGISLDKIMFDAIPASVEYVAWCEGDDYWIDETKLQKQISFLEKNKNFELCYSKIQPFHQVTGEFKSPTKASPMSCYNDLFFKGNGIPTLTSVVRKETLQKYRNEFKPENRSDWLMGDLPLWLYVSRKGKIKRFNEVMGVYRVLTESASHSANPEKRKAFEMSSRKIRKDFCDFYKEPEKWEQYENVIAFNEAISQRDRKKVHFLYKKLPLQAKTKKRFVLFLSSFSDFSFQLVIKKFF